LGKNRLFMAKIEKLTMNKLGKIAVHAPQFLTEKRSIFLFLILVSIFEILFLTIYKPMGLLRTNESLTQWSPILYMVILAASGLAVLIGSRILLYQRQKRKPLKTYEYLVWVVTEIVLFTLLLSFIAYNINANKDLQFFQILWRVLIDIVTVLLIPYIISILIFLLREQKQEIAALNALNPSDYKEWWTPEWYEAVRKGLFIKRDFKHGQMSRDMTLYVDDDGKAYHIFSSEDNLTLHIAELTDDYLHHSGRYTRVAPAGHNEAPAIFKKDGTYWMITSGCTGWKPNEARMFSATSIWGPWTQHPNPCVGPKAEITFGGQSTFILPYKDGFIFMADIWRPRHPSDARYIWLPIEFKDGKPVIKGER